jgi:hypothetical protein
MVRGSDVWNMRLTRMTSQSDFSGELLLTVLDEHATSVGSEWVHWELAFAFESAPSSVPPACEGDVLLLDDDGDGETNSRDLRPGSLDTSGGPGVDENGLSVAEFCRSAGGSGATASCAGLDFRNDEPGLKKPHDCGIERVRGIRSCVPREFFGNAPPVPLPHRCLGALTVGDADGDGEPDTTDRCPNTPPSSVIDGNGCSAEQFCSQQSVKLCSRADFLNDEPLVKKPGDCGPTSSKPPACAAAH